jgi:AcrR family transcriptional regulator
MPASPNPDTPNQTEARGAARREAILDAAVRLFARRGWRATGLVGLAREAGLTHSGLLHHFGSKENLLLAVVARRDEQQRALVTDARQYSGADAIRRMLPITGADQQANPDLTRLFAVLVAESLDPDEPLHDYFRDRHRGMRQYLAASVRTAQADGHFRADIDPDLAAAQIAAFIVGLQTLWLLDPDDIDLLATYQQQTKTLLDSLAPPQP